MLDQAGRNCVVHEWAYLKGSSTQSVSLKLIPHCNIQSGAEIASVLLSVSDDQTAAEAAVRALIIDSSWPNLFD